MRISIVQFTKMVNATETAGGRLGILFTGGDGPSAEWLQTLLPDGCQAPLGSLPRCQAPLLVAADSGLLLAERAGLRPHWIGGDMDSLDAERLAAYPPEIIFRYPHDKDYTDTEFAFSLLREKGCGPVWIIGGGGGRIDHLFGIRALFEREHPPERWVTAREDIRCIQAPSASNSIPHTKTPRHKKGRKADKLSLCPPLSFLRKSLSEDEVMLPSSMEFTSAHAPLDPVSVFPLGGGPWEAESSGLYWPLAGLDWNRGFFGLSNRAPSGAFSVRAKQGRFFVMTPIETSALSS